MSKDFNPSRLKSFIERIERLEEERKAIGNDVRDVYSEAKGVGYDVKTMRKVVALRKMDAADRDEQETLLDVYLSALGMAMEPAARAVMGGMSYGAAAAKYNVPKTSLHRVVPKSDDDGESGTKITTPEGTLAGEDEGTPAMHTDRAGVVLASDTYVATPSAPQLDEPRDTATQQETTHEREGNAGTDESPRRPTANRGRPVGAVASIGSSDEGEDGEERHSDGRCDAGRGDEATEQVTSGAVAEPSAAQRVASPEMQDDPWEAVGELPPHLRRASA